ncbi:MAG: hypothetical protein AAFY33_01850 [Cyanobacteria bacterium J06643_4]
MTHAPRLVSATASRATSLKRGLALFSMTTLVLLNGCSGENRASTQAVSNSATVPTADLSSLVSSDTSNTLSTDGSTAGNKNLYTTEDTARSVVEASVSQTSVSPQGNNLIAQASVEDDEPEREYDLRPLTDNELDEYRDHTMRLLPEHSFQLTYSDVGEANFVAAFSTEDSLRGLRLFLASADSGFHALPAHHEDYYMKELKAVSFQDLSDISAGPDIIVIAEYITGIGPTGNEPFPVTTVYSYQGNGQYSRAGFISELLTNTGVATIAEALAEIESLD